MTIKPWSTIRPWLLTLQVVQLVILNVLPPDREQDRRIMVACEENDDKFLEQNLNQPRDPNFEDANQVTLLYAAASNGNLRCVSLLIEAGACWHLLLWAKIRILYHFVTKTTAQQMTEQHLYSSQLSKGILKSSDFWWSPAPTKTKARLMMEQHLFSSQLSMGTLKSSDFWLSQVATKTKAPQRMEQRLFALQLSNGNLKLSDFWWQQSGTAFSRGGSEWPFPCPRGNPEILKSAIPIWNQDIIF